MKKLVAWLKTPKPKFPEVQVKPPSESKVYDLLCLAA